MEGIRNMGDNGNQTELVVRVSYDVQLRDFERGLLGFLEQHGLPTQSILVTVKERSSVFKNIDDVLVEISSEKKQHSVYLSKFMAATASGLFDAALNYLWDETISELRQRVAQYDLSYFYDNALSNMEKRRSFTSSDDLVRIEDSELIHGARKIGLISELGFKHLDYIRYMRNWASAAHPNQNEITGLQLVGWLQTCVNEVISLPLSDVVVDIKKLLVSIKTSEIDNEQAREIGAFFLDLTQDQVSKLASGLFGMYTGVTRSENPQQTRENIHKLLPFLWDRVDESTRQEFGIKYGKFTVDGDREKSSLARQFLELVNATSYMPNALKAAEIESALDNLVNAHRGFNNFYNEPPFAKELQRLVGATGNVPLQIRKKYVLALVEVFMGNAFGVSRIASPIYDSLVDLFSAEQALNVVLAFTDETIASLLQFDKCQSRYRELLSKMKIKIAMVAIRELIDDIETYRGPLEGMKDDKRIKQKVANLKKIIG